MVRRDKSLQGLKGMSCLGESQDTGACADPRRHRPQTRSLGVAWECEPAVRRQPWARGSGPKRAGRQACCPPGATGGPQNARLRLGASTDEPRNAPRCPSPAGVGAGPRTLG